MLISFRVRNFKSIVDTTLDLRYPAAEDSSCDEQGSLRFLQDNEDSPRVVPVLGLAHTTHLSASAEAMRAFLLLSCLVPLSPETQNILWQPNEQHPELQETEYTIEVLMDGSPYRYTLAHNQEEILREELWQGEDLLYRIDHGSDTYFFEGIETEEYPADQLRRILTEECSDADGHQQFTLLCRMSVFHLTEYSELSDFHLVLGAGQVYDTNAIPAGSALITLSTRINNENGENALREIGSLLKKLDIGVEALKPTADFRSVMRTLNSGSDSLDSETRDIAELVKVYRRAANGKKMYSLLRDETAEVQIIFGLLGVMLAALRGGDPLFLTDLGRTLSPALLQALIALFTSPATNKHGAQLIYTTHNPAAFPLSQNRG